jgi:hypothetical protein
MGIRIASDNGLWRGNRLLLRRAPGGHSTSSDPTNRARWALQRFPTALNQ